MTIVSLAQQSVSNAQATAACEIFPASSSDQSYILEIKFTIDNATSPQDVFGLGIPAVQGVGKTMNANNLFIEEDIAGLGSTAFLVTAWQVPPTAPTVFRRRATIANTTGTTWSWTFPNGLIIPTGNSVVLWNIANNDIVDIEVICDE